MSTINKAHSATRFIGKLQRLRRIFSPVLIPSITCFVLGLLLWGATLLKVDEEKRLLEKNALEDATFLSAAYAQHLATVLTQIDQITVLVKHQWEHSNRALRLENSFQFNLLSAPAHLEVNVVDRNGESITRSFQNARTMPSFAKRDYFIFHRANTANILFVGQPVTSRRTGKRVIHFSRRLETGDGTFDGVLVVTAQPSVFSSFYGGPDLGKAGFLGMIGKEDHLLRTSSIGGGAGESVIPALSAIPASACITTVLL